MAVLKMLCPFSHELCKECAHFRGRHWYLCFCKEYRGYIGKPKEVGGRQLGDPLRKTEGVSKDVN